MSKKYKTDKFPEPINMEDFLKGLEKESIYKYRLIETGIVRRRKTFYRIQALKDFNDVKKGDLGGYVHGYHNLSQEGNCWIYDKASVLNNARVFGNAVVSGNAIVQGHSVVKWYATVQDYTIVKDYVVIKGHVVLKDYVTITDNAIVEGNATVKGDANIKDNARVFGNAVVQDYSAVGDDAIVKDNAMMKGSSEAIDNAIISGNAVIEDDAVVVGGSIICGNAVISSQKDYIVFKNNWSSNRYLTYTVPNKMWTVGCFHGTSEELIEKAYKDSKLSGDMYSLYVELVKNIEKVRNENENEI